MTKRIKQISALYKTASKIGQKSGNSYNFSHAERKLKESNPGVEPSKEEVLAQILEDPFFSEEDLGKILNIELSQDHAKKLNKAEKAMLELGAFLTGKERSLSLIGDYMTAEAASPGWVSQRHPFSLNDMESVKKAFNALDESQDVWHRRAAQQQQQADAEEGRFGYGYETNEVVYSFADGWKIVYVPAIGEGPNYKGDHSKSHDRTVEGNHMGICLGEKMGYNQNNNDGKIYSLRRPDNKPKVTFNIKENILQEAKGQGNGPPDIPSAKKAKEWLEQIKGLEYKESADYKAFPPTELKAAKSMFAKNPDSPYKGRWAAYWFGQGIPELDADIKRRISKNDFAVLASEIFRKYKELVQPVAKFWTEEWMKKRHNYTGYDPEDEPYVYDNDIFKLNNFWKTYKKEAWMKKAIERLFIIAPELAFTKKMHKHPEFLPWAHEAAEIWAETEDEDLFKYGLPDDPNFRDMIYKIAKTWAKEEKEKFLANKLHMQYKVKDPRIAQLAREIAEDFADRRDPKYLIYGFYNEDSFDDLTNEFLESLVRQMSPQYLRYKLHKLSKFNNMTQKYVENLVEEGSEVFFNYGFDEDERFEDLTGRLAEVWAERGDHLYFDYYFHNNRKFKKQTRKIAEILAERGDHAFRLYDLDKRPEFYELDEHFGDKEYFEILREQRRLKEMEENKREQEDSSSRIEEKLASLYKFLSKLGFPQEALLIKESIKQGYL